LVRIKEVASLEKLRIQPTTGYMAQQMKLKYAKEIVKIADCPPTDAEPFERQVYRFVYGEIGDPRKFLPMAKKNPQRRLKDDHECCIAHALSMFATKDGAVVRYRKLQKTHKRIHKTIGNHLAEGTLTKSDGRGTPPDGGQHLSFFEAENIDLAGKFQIVEVLCDD